MPTFSLNEALRYLVTAAIIATYAYFMLTTEQLKALQEAAARPGFIVLITVLIFAASALAFNAYRQLVYNVGIRTLLTLFGIVTTSGRYSAWVRGIFFAGWLGRKPGQSGFERTNSGRFAPLNG